jgi:hypothetical protein
MLISARQVIVLGISLVALGGGVGGLIIVSHTERAPSPEPKKMTLMPNPGTRYWEKRPEKKPPALPKPTEAPPLATGNSDESKAAATGSIGSQTAEKKAPAHSPPKSKEKSAAQPDDETIAAEKLKQAKAYLAQKNNAKAKECCQEIIDKYSHTKALVEAADLFNELK